MIIDQGTVFVPNPYKRRRIGPQGWIAILSALAVIAIGARIGAVWP